jgi:hypothetical protein
MKYFEGILALCWQGFSHLMLIRLNCSSEANQYFKIIFFLQKCLLSQKMPSNLKYASSGYSNKFVLKRISTPPISLPLSILIV